MAESKALLSQSEIDALVSFLSSQKDSIENDVMNQESIDKLIGMLNSGFDLNNLADNKGNDFIRDRSLLGQNEIDALVNFLNTHKDSNDNSILTQEKIDKLVEMLKAE